MSNRAKLNIALSVGLLTLFVIIYLEQRGSVDEDVRIAQLDVTRVETMRIEVRGREPVLLARDGDAWHMVEPLSIPVDARRVHGIIEALSIRSQANYPASRLDLDALDLADDPQARVVVDGEAWIVGERNPLEGARYIRQGDVVHLATDVLYFRLLGDPAGYASRQLLPAGTTIARIELPGITVAGDDSGHQVLIDAWRYAQATRVISIDDVGAALRAATVRIVLQEQDAPLEFLVHATDDDFHLLREDLGLAFVMSKSHEPEMLHIAGTP